MHSGDDEELARKLQLDFDYESQKTETYDIVHVESRTKDKNLQKSQGGAKRSKFRGIWYNA
jgi:hypothetical protein